MKVFVNFVWSRNFPVFTKDLNKMTLNASSAMIEPYTVATIKSSFGP